MRRIFVNEESKRKTISQKTFSLDAKGYVSLLNYRSTSDGNYNNGLLYIYIFSNKLVSHFCPLTLL